MAERSRNTKKLAQRIDRGYLKRDFWLPRWKRLLSIGATALGVAWLGWQGLAGKQEVFNAGPLAHSHQMLAQDCASCHVSTGAFAAQVTDTRCVACHDAPRHQAKQTFTPACTSCHVEHQGAFRLASMGDASCAQCHRDLRTGDGKHAVDASIGSLADGHPEFAAVRKGHRADAGTIKFGHAIHMKAGLKGPAGPVQLECTGCHVAAAATAGERPTGLMKPVEFEQHCANCHPLNFDRRFAEPAPHKDTQVVLDYVTAQYRGYIAAHPGEVGRPVELNTNLPVRPVPSPARSAAEWVAQRTAEAERLLWQKACKECHLLTYPAPTTRPEVAKASIPAQWMPRARFEHGPHQLVQCLECHAQATARNESADVMLPGIASCQRCHNDGANAAGATCSECHRYHDWSKATMKQGTFRVR